MSEPLTDAELDAMLGGFTKEIDSERLERLVAEVRRLRASTTCNCPCGGCQHCDSRLG